MIEPFSCVTCVSAMQLLFSRHALSIVMIFVNVANTFYYLILSGGVLLPVLHPVVFRCCVKLPMDFFLCMLMADECVS